MIQIDVIPVNTPGKANEILREYQRVFPKRKIVNISMTPNDYGWFMTVVYEVTM